MDPPPLPHHPTILTLTPLHLHHFPTRMDHLPSHSIRQSSLSLPPPLVPFHNHIPPPRSTFPLPFPSIIPHRIRPTSSTPLPITAPHFHYPYSLHLFLSPSHHPLLSSRSARNVARLPCSGRRGDELATTELSSHTEVPAGGLVPSSLRSLHAALHDVPLPCQQRCHPFPPPTPAPATSHPPSIMVPSHHTTVIPSRPVPGVLLNLSATSLPRPPHSPHSDSSSPHHSPAELPGSGRS
jgi:hypothetical protein